MTTEEIMRRRKLYEESPELLLELIGGTKDTFDFSELIVMITVAAEMAVEKVLEDMFSRGLTSEDFSYLYSGKIRVVREESA